MKLLLHIVEGPPFVEQGRRAEERRSASESWENEGGALITEQRPTSQSQPQEPNVERSRRSDYVRLISWLLCCFGLAMLLLADMDRYGSPPAPAAMKVYGGISIISGLILAGMCGYWNSRRMRKL